MTTNNKPILTTTKEKIKPKTHSQDFIPSFIRKTYDILEEAKFPQLIDWSPEGNAIVIKKPSEFSQKVLPVYFKHNNLTSFVRQLNMYNFHKRRSQNLEHVYSHELFQKGKRHLLKEIKRKTHEQTDKAQKSPESQETPKAEEVSTLVNENQFLKRLYNEAMSRVALLENQAKELANQNQSLWAQIYRTNNDREKGFKPLVAPFEGQKEIQQEQLPMTMGKVTLNISSNCKVAAPVTRLFNAPNGMQLPMKPMFHNPHVLPNGHNMAMAEESSGSTEVSPVSPVLHSKNESEGNLERSLMMANQPLQIPKLRFEHPNNVQALQIPQIPHQQAVKMNSELGVSRNEMSVGQIFEAWNLEFQQGEEVLCFADQKGDSKTSAVNAVPTGNIQAVFQDKSLLGKRKFENESSLHVPEPTMKRHELSIFSRKGMISTGIEDKEIHDSTTGAADDIDLMNFNQPFLGWPKAS